MSALSQAHAKFKKFRYDLKNEKSTADKMSTREKLSINLVNSGGDNCMNTLKGSFFNVFLTTSLGLDPTTIALLATVTTILGYIKDPITALIIESTRTKWGRFKPYVVICMPAVVLLNFAFMMNPFSDYQAKVIYVFTLEILLSILSGFAGAWGNMKRCLSRDKKERENYNKNGKSFPRHHRLHPRHHPRPHRHLQGVRHQQPLRLYGHGDHSVPLQLLFRVASTAPT